MQCPTLETTMQPLSTAELDKLADSYFHTICKEKSVPLDIAKLPPFLQNYLAIASLHTDAVPGALITAFLPVAAVNIGNRVSIRGNGKNHYCQIWSVLVGKSSVSRKSTCLRLANRTLLPYHNSLKKLEAQERMVNELIISNVTNAKLVSLLAVNPVRLLEFHEFGSLLKSTAQSYNMGMKENLTSLYDGDSKTICNMERTERIINPAISISGASTEGWILGGFQNAAEQDSGFLQRFIFCLIKEEGKRICSSLEEQELSYSELYGYDSIFKVFRNIPGSQKIRLSRELRALWLAEHDRILNEILEKEDEALLAYATRIYNNVFCSLVIIITLMENHLDLAKALERGKTPENPEESLAGFNPEIGDKLAKLSLVPSRPVLDYFSGLKVSRETVEQALYLCHYYLENARPMLTIISEGGAWINERRIIKHLSKQPENKDTHSNIMNALRIKSKDLKESIGNLIDQRAIRSEIVNSQGTYKPTMVYHLLPSANQMYS
jgi:hypothetical protein